MSDLMVFAVPTGGQLRTLTDEHGKPWVLAGDACAALDIVNIGNALARLDDDEKSSIRIADGTPGNPNKAIVNEPGLYSLIFQSRKPEAKAFKRWITHEVLPAIIKTGRYDVAMRAPQTYAEALRELAASVEAKEQAQAALEAARPMVDAWQTFLDSGGDHSVDEVAKMLARADIKTGRDRLYSTLHAWGWIYRYELPEGEGVGPWKAKQSQVDCGRLAMLPRQFRNRKTGGMQDAAPQVRVTPKGAEEIRRRLAPAP